MRVPDCTPNTTDEDPAALALFGEGPGRFVASAAPGQLTALQALAASGDVSCTVIGRVGGEVLRIACRDGHQDVDAINLPVAALANAWESLEV